ncbi:MAG: ParA family protein [Solirubrobacterales bacterium]|nr:ParA family protein [Solirubrobacterales bacterium]
MGIVHAIANQKGGVGKTTTTVNVSACVAEAGYSTLIVDLDAQCNATVGLGFVEGLAGLLDTVALIQREMNPNLRISGMLLTMHDGRTRLAEDVEREVREHFPELVFDTVIPRNVRLAEAPSFGLPVIHYDPHCAGSDAYFALAKEVAARG